ncbi:MAG: agmatinase family protein [Alistipes sp.]|nr:agmatinase family protein [Alistipes sp.]
MAERNAELNPATGFDPNGVGVANGSYFGMPFTPEEASLVLISAPWDVTVSYGAGTAYAPDSLIEASTQLDLYDPAAPNAWQRGIATADIDYTLHELSDRLRNDARRVIAHLEQGGETTDDYVVRKIRRVNEGSEELNRNIHAEASQWLDAGKVVGLVGGDHSTPYGLLAALGERHEHFGVLQIDAHCDLRACYEGFEYSHASIMYNVLRDIPAVERITQVGVRDFSAAELRMAEQSGRVAQFGDHDLMQAAFDGESWSATCERIVATLPKKVYISFDIDGLDIEYCPNSGAPVPGGLNFNQAVALLKKVADSGRQIIGFDLVEVGAASEERAKVDAIVGARMLWKLCGQTLRTLPTK